MKVDLTKILLNYVIPILIVAIIYLLYKYYIKLFINIKEHFSNKTKPILCDDNSCGKGCQRPNKINDSCPTTIYKDVDGNCHRKCPYVCPDKSDKCKHDECCVGCGYKKMAVPCDLAKKYNNQINNNKKGNNEPSPNKGKNTTANPNTKNPGLTTTDVNHKDTFYKDWSPYVSKWPCGMNVTGTFTECGPDAYNNCGK